MITRDTCTSVYTVLCALSACRRASQTLRSAHRLPLPRPMPSEHAAAQAHSPTAPARRRLAAHGACAATAAPCAPAATRGAAELTPRRHARAATSLQQKRWCAHGSPRFGPTAAAWKLAALMPRRRPPAPRTCSRSAARTRRRAPGRTRRCRSCRPGWRPPARPGRGQTRQCCARARSLRGYDVSWYGCHVFVTWPDN